MVAAVHVREDGFAEMAYIGAKPWHGLGQELEKNQPIEVWMKAAGMDWEVLSSPAFYSYLNEDGNAVTEIFDDKKVLFRSDTKAPLSVVGHKYHVVHPGEVLEFFRDLTYLNDMHLSTAGVLFGGRRFWALAEIGDTFELANGDQIKGNLLLTTSVDGTLATTAKFVSTRVVCNNTLTWALNKEQGHMVKVSHRSEFSPEDVKIDMGVYNDSWNRFTENVTVLSASKVNDKKAKQFFEEISRNGKGEVSRLKVERLDNFYRNGQGADLSKGTAWGLLNAVTEMYTHGTNKTNGDNSNKFWSAYNGVWSNEKTKAYQLLMDQYAKKAA